MTIDPMPSWLNPVPFGDVGRGELPGNPQQRDVLSEDQLQQMRNQLLESILSSVVQAVRGLFVPGPFGAALQQLEEWAGDLPGSFADILTWIQEKTGLDFTDPGLFLSSLVTRLVDDVEGFVTQVSNALWNLAGFANDLWAGLNEATGLTWDAGPLDFVTSLAEKIFDTFQIDLGSPEDLFNSIQSNIGTVFTTIGGVLSWVESETGLNFSQGPENFIQSLINTVLDGFGVDLNGPYELWASITNPLETILSLSEGALTNFLGNLTVFFNGLPNIFDGSFNLQSAVQSFLTDTLGIAQIGAAGLQFVESLIPNVLGALDDFFDNVASFLGIDLRQIASGDFIPGLAFITFLTNIKDVLLEWIRFYVFGGVQTIGEWVEDNIFNPIAQTFLGGLKLPPALLGVTEIAEAGLGVLGDIAGTLLTSLTAIPAALLEGILPPGLLGQVPVSNISDTSPNLINLGAFAEAGNIEAADGWSWDATNNAPGSAGGSAKFVIDQAADHYLYSRQAVPVGKGDRLVLSAKVLTSGLTVSPGGSTPITIALVPFIGSSQQTPVPVGTARGSTTSWSSVGNATDDPYVVTNADWTSVIVRLTVASTATAGTVWWDEVSLTKTGKLVQDNVDSLVDAWNSMIGGLEGLGESASGYDWTRLFTSSANARQQGTVAQSRLDNTNTNLFGTPLGGTTFAPENLPTLISNLAAVKVDGNATMSNFLDGLLSGFGVQLPPGGATVDDVATGASALTNTANTASQAASTAGTNIQSTWDELYDAFGGTTGSSNRTLAETRNRGAAVRNSAVTGEANASTALTNAATAQGTADTAVTNAATANTIANAALAIGSNLIPNNSFEDNNIVIAGSGAERGSIGRTGTKSLKLTAVNGSFPYAYLLTNTVQTYWIKTKSGGGDVYRYSMFVYGDPSNSENATIRFGINTYNTAGSFVLGAYSDIAASPSLNSVWTEYTGTITVPTNAAIDRILPFIQLRNLSNEIYYFDDVTLRLVSDSQEALSAAGAAQLDADAAQAQANTATTNAATAQTTADRAKLLGELSLVAGQNLVSNPRWERSDFFVSFNTGVSFDTSFKRSGARSVKLTSTNSHQSVYMFATDANFLYLNVVPGSVLYMEAWVYGDQNNPGTTQTAWGWQATYYRPDGTYTSVWLGAVVSPNASRGQWVKSSLYYTVPSDCVRITFYGVSLMPVGNAVWVDDCVVKDVTEAYYAQLDADAAQAQANTATTNAATADGKAVAADTKAVVAQSAISDRIASGQNLVFEGGFENAKVWPLSGQWSRSTAYKRNGSYSAKCVANGITQSLGLNRNLTSTVYWTTAQSKKYYIEFWLYAPTSNAGTAGLIQVWNAVRNTAGAWVYPPGAGGTYVSNLTKGVWTKFSGIVNLDGIDAVYWYPYLRVDASTTSGEFYFDDVYITDVTDAYDAQLDADAAQAQANTATTNAAQADAKAATADGKAVEARKLLEAATNSAANLIPDPGFENADLDAVRQAGAAFMSLSADWSYDNSSRGVRCLKHVFRGGTVYPSVNLTPSLNANGVYIPVTPGQVFRMAQYIYANNGNTGSGECNMYLQTKYANGTVNWQGAQFFPTKGSWNRYEKTFVMPANAVGVMPMFCAVRPGNNAGDIFWVDDVELFDITDAYNAQQDADAAQADASTGIANAATAQGAADSAATAAATADGKAAIAKSLAHSALQAGPNLATNPGFENTNLWMRLSNSTYSTEQKRSGIRSFKTAGPTYSGLFSDEDGQITLPCSPGDIYALEIWVYGHEGNPAATGGYGTAHFQSYNASGGLIATTYIGGWYLSPAQVNAAKGVWTKLSATITIPANAVRFTITGMITTALVPSNLVLYWDDFACYRITEAQAAQTAADEADGKAVAAQTTIETVAVSGNKVYSPNFEDSTVTRMNYSPTTSTLSYDTDEYESGVQSLKMVVTGSGWNGPYLAPVPGLKRFMVNPGERWSAAISFKPSASNDYSNAGNYVRLFMRFFQVGSFSDATNIAQVSVFNNGQMTPGAWHHLTVEGTVPAGCTGMEVFVLSSPAMPNGSTFWFDNASVREITNAYNAQLDADAAAAEANTATTNAATAQGTADSAATAAATADGKAVVAQGAINTAVTAGGNLLPNGDFENTSFGLSKLSYTTAEKYTGTRCVSMTSGNGSWWDAYPARTTDNVDIKFPCREGDVFAFECWVKAKSTNTGTGGIWLQGGIKTAAGSHITTYNADYTDAVPGGFGWKKMSGTIVCPADSAYMILDVLTNTNAVGDTLYFDAMRLYRITEAQAAQVDADAAQAQANTATTNAATAQGAADTAASAAATADGKAVAAQTAASTADGKAVAAQGLVSSVQRLGANILPNGNFENITYYTGNGVYDSTVKRSGTYSCRLTGQGVRINLTTGFQTGDTFVNSVPCRPSATFRVEGWVYGDPANTGGGSIQVYVDDYNTAGVLQPQQYAGHAATTAMRGVWTKVGATITVSANAASTYIFIYHAGQPAGDKYYYDNFVAYEITEAQGAQNAADTADGKAVDARTDFRLSRRNGINLIPNPSFEDTRYPVPYATFTTEDAHWGSRSLKLTSAGSPLYPQPLVDEFGTYRIECVANQYFYYEFWIKGHADNSKFTGTEEVCSFGFWLHRKDGSYYTAIRDVVRFDQVGKGNWVKISGVRQMPNVDFIGQILVLMYCPAIPSGDIYYLDDFVLRDITEAQAAQLDADSAFSSASTAQSAANTAKSAADLAAATASSALASGDNLIPNSGFEQPATLWAQAGGSISDFTARTGSKSLKLTGSGSPYAYLFNGATSLYELPCKSGDVFKFSYWVRGVTGNTTCTARFGIATFNEAGSNVQYHIYDYAVAASTSWVQITGTITVPTTTNTRFRPYLQVLSNPGNTMYFDDVVLERITEVAATNKALYGQNTPGTAIQTDAVPTLPQAKVSGLPVGFLVEDELAQHAAEISELKAAREVSINQGKTISVNFANYSNSSSLPTTGSQRWSTTYSGSGTATWGISNGKAAWIGSTSVARTAKVIYLGDGTAGSEKTLTDYQVLRGVLQNPPLNQEFTAMARVSDDGNTYVWAKAIATLGFFTVNVTGSIGCVVNGVSTTWQSNIPLTWSTEMTLKCGVDGDPRKFQVFSGTTLVTQYTESGTSSGLGAGYRRFGAIAKCGNNATSGTISSVTVSDNPPVVYAGSVARMSRTNTGNDGDFTTSVTPLPNNPPSYTFFDQVDFESLDIDADLNTGSFTVSKGGMYRISARAQFASGVGINNCALVLQRSTNGGSTWVSEQFGGNSYVAADGNWLQYLEAGDKVRLATWRTVGSTSNAMVGEATGARTFFTISGNSN